DKATVIHPPFRRVLFRSKETWNDGLLEERYSQKSGLKPEKAKAELESFLADVNTELDIKKKVDFPELGYLRINERGTTSFVVNQDLFISKDSFGLEPVKLKILEKIGTVENLKSRRLKIFSDEEIIKKLSSERRAPNFVIQKSALKWMIIILVVVILIALLVIFNDHLKPLWEIILYNKEEREILRSISN
ncbi:MAG: hypothetical protein QMB82_07645, partial [Bacteroidales bacterium]